MSNLRSVGLLKFMSNVEGMERITTPPMIQCFSSSADEPVEANDTNLVDHNDTGNTKVAPLDSAARGIHVVTHVHMPMIIGGPSLIYFDCRTALQTTSYTFHR